MKSVGVIGLGDMGSGLARNCLKAGFEVWGRDLDAQRQAQLVSEGVKGAASAAEVGRKAQAVFVMVMAGAHAQAAIFGADGLASAMAPGTTIILSATIKPSEAEAIAAGLEGTGIDLIDTPVSGGFPGAQGGTLTMMAAAPKAVLAREMEVLRAVGKDIHHVGERPGMGQTVKACLQALLGSMFAATFEAAVLAAKSGVDPVVFHKVVSTSSGGAPLVANALEKIMAGAFTGTGSAIATMYKDLTISNDHGREQGVPLFMAAAALQLFQAGITKYPAEDNWTVTKVLEEIVGAEFRKAP